MPIWTGKAIAEMHVHDITGEAIAEHLGVAPTYLSAIFNGKRNPRGARERVMNAIKELKEGKDAET